MAIISGIEFEKNFLDSSVTYAGAATTTITGLSHLEGVLVSILADGLVVAPKTVVDGAITLDVAASVVHVGLPYESILQPMRIDSDNQLGGTQGLVKRIHKLVFNFLDTAGPLGLSTGPTGTPINIPLVTSGPTVLFRGDREVDYSGDYDHDATFVVRQAQPLPMTLLGVVVKYQVTES